MSSTTNNEITVALVQVSARSAFYDGAHVISENLDQLLELVRQFNRTEHADLIVLPKGAIQGRPPKGAEATELLSGALKADSPELIELAKLAANTESHLVLGAYLADTEGGAVFSSGLVIGANGIEANSRQLSRDSLDHVHGSTNILDIKHENGKALFPVATTRAGRVGCVVGPDIDIFEVPKAFVYAGAEVIAHPSYAPTDARTESRRQALRARGYESVCLVASCDLADPYENGASTSCIVDWTGTVVVESVQRTPGYVSARIDLETLRERRRRVSMNFPIQTRTHFFADAMTWAGETSSGPFRA